MLNKKIHVIEGIKVLVSLFSVLLLMVNTQGEYNSFEAIVIIGTSLYSTVLVRKNWNLLIIYGSILYCNYSICMANYISPINSFFGGYAGTGIGTIGIHVLLVFSVLLLLIATSTPGSLTKGSSLIHSNRDNSLIVIGLLIVLAIIWVYGYTRPELAGERGSPSALYEYSIIFIILSYYYAGGRKPLYVLITGAAAAFAVQNFIFGGRITGLQLIIAVVLCLFTDKLSYKVLIPAGLGLFIIMAMIGQFRAKLVLSNNVLKQTINTIITNKLTMDTAYSSYYTSMTFVDMLQTTDVGQRLYLFSRWILSIIFGGRVSDSNLSDYTRQFYLHYYGGVLPFYGFFYLSYAGVVLQALYMKLLFDRIGTLTRQSSGFVRCFSIYITCTSFRWYLYSPSQLFRGLMLLGVLFIMLHGIDCILKHNPVRLSEFLQ